MVNKELPITLEEQVIQMKKYVSFRQRIKMRKFEKRCNLIMHLVISNVIKHENEAETVVNDVGVFI